MTDLASGGQNEVIAFLSDGATFGVEEVELVETHCSLVFLAGQRAYKLKRAVRYSYLDYSTPEKRRRACEEEVRISGAFAPALYLGVVSVTRSADGQLEFG